MSANPWGVILRKFDSIYYPPKLQRVIWFRRRITKLKFVVRERFVDYQQVCQLYEVVRNQFKALAEQLEDDFILLPEWEALFPQIQRNLHKLHAYWEEAPEEVKVVIPNRLEKLPVWEGQAAPAYLRSYFNGELQVPRLVKLPIVLIPLDIVSLPPRYVASFGLTKLYQYDSTHIVVPKQDILLLTMEQYNEGSWVEKALQRNLTPSLATEDDIPYLGSWFKRPIVWLHSFHRTPRNPLPSAFRLSKFVDTYTLPYPSPSPLT